MADFTKGWVHDNPSPYFGSMPTIYTVLFPPPPPSPWIQSPKVLPIRFWYEIIFATKIMFFPFTAIQNSKTKSIDRDYQISGSYSPVIIHIAFGIIAQVFDMVNMGIHYENDSEALYHLSKKLRQPTGAIWSLRNTTRR